MAKFFKLATKSIPNFKGIKCNFVTAVDISTSNDVNDDQRIFMASHVSTSIWLQCLHIRSIRTQVSRKFTFLML